MTTINLSHASLRTYYLSYHCSPTPGHSNASRYIGMVADVFVTSESEQGVEDRIESHFKDKGWLIVEMNHAELVEAPAKHDSSLSALYHLAQEDGLASLLSPY